MRIIFIEYFQVLVWHIQKSQLEFWRAAQPYCPPYAPSPAVPPPCRQLCGLYLYKFGPLIVLVPHLHPAAEAHHGEERHDAQRKAGVAFCHWSQRGEGVRGPRARAATVTMSAVAERRRRRRRRRRRARASAPTPRDRPRDTTRS